MTPIADILEVLVKSLTDRLALALLFMSLICFGVMATPTDVGTFLRVHWAWPFFCCLFCVCYIPTRHIIDWVNEKLANGKKHERLQHLTRKEKEFLAPYVHNDFRSRRVFHSDPVAQGLQDDGILWAPAVARDDMGGKAYNIQNWVLIYLKRNPGILTDVPKNPNHGGDR